MSRTCDVEMFLPKTDGIWLSLNADAKMKIRNIRNCER